MRKEGNLLSKLMVLKRRKKCHKMNITWEKILLIIVIIVLFPELHDQMYLARSRSTRMEIFLNSEGMSYLLGEAVSKKELHKLLPSWDCGNGLNWWAIEAHVLRGAGFFTTYDTKRDPQNVYAINVKRFSEFFFSPFRVVEVEFRYDDFRLYEICSGMNREKAEACLRRHGYKEWEGEYWKRDVAIMMKTDEKGVHEITVRWYSWSEHQAMIKAYKKEHKN